MSDRVDAQSWNRLLRLLDPIHRRAQSTARRLAASSDDGDDLYQETVLHAFGKLDQLRDESSFGSWFFAILLSKHRSRSRRAFWKRFLPLADLTGGDGEPAVDPSFGDEDREGSSQWRFRKALQSLPAGEREALVLHELQGFSTEEVAALQGIAASSARSRLTRGRRRLARYYARHGWVPSSSRENRSGLTTIRWGGSL